MDLVDYRLFTQLCQTMHFGRTARTLGMSASALTRRVQAVEDELGHRLFIRDHREVRLTSAGKRFRAFAQAHLDQWTALQNDLGQEDAAPTGTLDLACTVTAAHTVLPKLLAEFRRRFPGVTWGLITQDATRSLNQLEAGEVDLAVIPTDDEPPSHLSHVVLGRTEFSFIAPREFGEFDKILKKRALDWSAVPLIAPIGGLERKRLDDYLRAHEAHPPIVAEVRGNEGIIAMVSLGGGVGLVPHLVLESSPLRQSVVELTQIKPPPGYDVSLCTRPRSLERRVIQLFWQLAKQGV